MPKVVLIVDDDEPTGEALERLLQRTGYVAACAPRGSDCFTFVDTLRPDLIVLDWMMPEMDGLQVLRRLREIPGLDGLPVLVYTAADLENVRHEAERFGAEVVPKSNGVLPLYERIAQHLGSPAS